MPQIQTQAPAPAAPAPPPAPGVGDIQGVTVVQGAQGGVTVQLPGGASPRAVYQAAKTKRDDLGELMVRLRNRRTDLAEQLRRSDVTGVDRAGLEKHLAEVDGRLIEMEKQMQAAEIEMAAATVPGALRGDRPLQPNAPYEDEVGVGIGLGFVLLIPVVVAYTRRLWKRANVMVAPIPQMLQDRIARMEQSIDAIAVEVERVSEGQRFMTKLFADGGQRALAQGAAQPVELPAHEATAGRR